VEHLYQAGARVQDTGTHGFEITFEGARLGAGLGGGWFPCNAAVYIGHPDAHLTQPKSNHLPARSGKCEDTIYAITT